MGVSQGRMVPATVALPDALIGVIGELLIGAEAKCWSGPLQGDIPSLSPAAAQC